MANEPMPLFGRYPPMNPSTSPDRASKASDQAARAPSKSPDNGSFTEELKREGPSPHTGDDQPSGDSVEALKREGPSPHVGDD